MSTQPKTGATPDIIASALRREIMNGDLRPGLALRQEDLAARFAVSRMPIRDALRLLEADGLVVIAANRGASVSSLSIAEVEEIFHLRTLLECDCLQAACVLMDDASLRQIDRACARAEFEAGTPEWADADWAFHEALYAPSRRSRQLTLIRSLRMTSNLYAVPHGALPTERERWLADHRAIMDACQRRQADEAVAALRSHLRAAGEFVLRHMQRTAQGSDGGGHGHD